MSNRDATVTEQEIRNAIEDIRIAMDQTYYRRPEQAAKLAHDLDCRGAPCPYPGTWLQRSQPEPAANLVRFITEHMPELWVVKAVPIRPEAPDPGEVIHRLDTPVIHRLDTPKAMNVRGWTIQCDKRGFHRAFRKIGGRTRCIYIGKSLDCAAEKIARAEGKFSNGSL